MSYREREEREDRPRRREPRKEEERLPAVTCLRTECGHVGPAERSLSGALMCSKCSTLSVRKVI